MIDCHCHLLPGIDDGAHGWEDTLAMAQAAVAAGTTAILCTPHHLNGVYENTAEDIRSAVRETGQRLQDAGVALTLHPGSELHLVPELPAQLRDGTALTYNDRGKAALVELPKSTVPMGTETILEQLLYRGITPVIAHPERNAALANGGERLGEWIGWGCKAQLTAQSCRGDFGERLAGLSRHWLERGWIHLLASDAHRPRGRSPDKLAAGREIVAEWLGDEAATLLTLTNPQRLLDGEPLESLPARVSAARVRKRSFLGRLLRRR
ncbi:MAG: protein-tyrosine-phosphatase [Chromatiaceae bacterium]|nr:protein-tyrosine-phosphatase [Chromatiaceae bacterium]